MREGASRKAKGRIDEDDGVYDKVCDEDAADEMGRCDRGPVAVRPGSAAR